MIDLHCHILPGVDDGSPDLETSLDMIRMAAASGVKTMVATPHCNLPHARFSNYISPELRDRFVTLCKAVARENIPVSILPGAEIMCTSELPQLLQEHKLLGLGGSHYLLVEFVFDEPLSYMTDMLRRIASHGVTPVVAHPERYDAVQQQPRIAETWFQEGFLLQVNKDSILGEFGHGPEVAADWLLRHHLLHAVASDAHGVVRRTTPLDQLCFYLQQAYSPQLARLVLRENPRRMIHDQPALYLP